MALRAQRPFPNETVESLRIGVRGEVLLPEEEGTVPALPKEFEPGAGDEIRNVFDRCGASQLLVHAGTD